MKVKACIYTDAGKKRAVNQDSSLIKVASAGKMGRISFVAVCDGMGGLSKGEVASCKAIRTLENWFHEELSLMLGIDEDKIWDVIEISWRRLLADINRDIRRYGKHRGIKLGTTLTAFLQIGRKYMLMNVGDSRIYLVSRKDVQKITHDQSLVQSKIDSGVMLEDEVQNSQERNVLLQCLGHGSAPQPQIIRGDIQMSTTVVACSDGLWKTISEKELFRALCPQMCVTSEDMLEECKKLTMTAIDRKEQDNITVAAMCLEY